MRPNFRKLVCTSVTTQIDKALQAFLPELMMQRGELSKARRLLRKLSRIREQSEREGALSKAARKGHEHFARLRETVWSEMDALAADVWKREVGLERYSVIRVQRDDAEFSLQVLKFSFRDGLPWREHWMWELGGRALRKDGSLGLKDMGVVLRFANLYRRHLDGTWHLLRWLDEESSDASFA
jgi:hypothetical protein